MKRKTGVVTRKCRLLCDQCLEIRQVSEISEDGDLIILSCSHSRKAEALPLIDGRVSFEAFINLRHLSDAAQKLFPVSRADEETSELPYEDFSWR